MTSSNLQGPSQIHQLIVSSLSANKQERQSATTTLDQLKLDLPTTTILLQYIQDPQFDEQNRTIAAVLLKNKIKAIYGQHSYTHYEERRNAGEENQDETFGKIDDQSVQLLQQNLVNLMMSSPKKIADQFLEVISLMSKRFIQNDWPTLVPELLSHIENAQDPLIIRYSLECFKKICKKYRYMFRSDALYMEMNYMIESLSQHLLHQANNCVNMIKANPGNIDAVSTLFGILNSIVHIIESFLAQEELPDFYEENLENIASILSFVLESDFSQLQKIPNEIVKCRAKVVRVVHVYQFKFNEHFLKYQQYFFDKIWAMVSNNQVPANKQNEKLIHAILRYLTEMSTYPPLQDFFKQNMVPLFQLIIVPNISITEDDIDEYEMEPDTYIRNDLEESDTDTRRRQCMKFVQQLSKKFPNEVTQIIGDYVNNLLADYAKNREGEWMKKTTVLNLIITASITQYTYKHGAESILIPFEVLGGYLEQLVLPELEEQNIDNLSLLKATCIKFIYMFRNQIPDNFVPVFLGKVSDFLKSENQVNQSYAAACIEKLLVRKTSNGQGMIFSPQNIDPNMIGKLLQNLCELLQTNKNLYAIRSLYRTVQLSQNNIIQFAEVLGQVLGNFIHLAAKDEAQSSPNYLYILFETAALTLKFVKDDPVFEKVEESLSVGLNFVIEQNVTDMIAYSFQIYSLFVANSKAIKQSYQVLTESILTNMANWEKDMRYLIPGLANFLISIIFKYPDFANKYITNILQIMAHLINVDIRMEQTSLQTASAIFEKMGIPSDQFLHDYLMAIFTTLHFYRNNTKTKTIPVKIVRSIWTFFANFMIYNNTQALVNACNNIQQDILFMIMKSEGDKIRHITAPFRDRKYAIIAYSQFIQDMMQTIPDDVLTILIKSLIELCFATQQGGFQLASTLTTDTEDLLQDGAIDQQYSFQRSEYVQLNAARIEQTDKLAQQFPQPESFLLQVLKEVENAKGAPMSVIVNDEKHRSQLAQMATFFGVQFN